MVNTCAYVLPILLCSVGRHHVLQSPNKQIQIHYMYAAFNGAASGCATGLVLAWGGENRSYTNFLVSSTPCCKHLSTSLSSKLSAVSRSKGCWGSCHHCDCSRHIMHHNTLATAVMSVHCFSNCSCTGSEHQCQPSHIVTKSLLKPGISASLTSVLHCSTLWSTTSALMACSLA